MPDTHLTECVKKKYKTINEQTLKGTNGPRTHKQVSKEIQTFSKYMEKMFNLFSHKGNINLSYTEILAHPQSAWQ